MFRLINYTFYLLHCAYIDFRRFLVHNWCSPDLAFRSGNRDISTDHKLSVPETRNNSPWFTPRRQKRRPFPHETTLPDFGRVRREIYLFPTIDRMKMSPGRHRFSCILAPACRTVQDGKRLLSCTGAISPFASNSIWSKRNYGAVSKRFSKVLTATH